MVAREEFKQCVYMAILRQVSIIAENVRHQLSKVEIQSGGGDERALQERQRESLKLRP